MGYLGLMVQPISNRLELETWLVEAFGEPSDILRFASTHLGLSQAQLGELPRGESPAAMVHALVTWLERHALIDRLWPALRRARPARAAEVHALENREVVALRPTLTEDDAEDLAVRYREEARKRWTPTSPERPGVEVPYIDLSVALEVALPLDRLTAEERELFFEVNHSPPAPGWSKAALLDEAREDRHKREDARTRRLPLQATLERSDSWVLLGDPGAGKTTALQHLAVCAASRADGPLPIFARLEQLQLAKNEQQLGAELRAQIAVLVEKDLRLPGAAALVSSALCEGPVILLLDGLDEQGTQEQRERMAAALDQLGRELPPDSRLIASSRVVGYREARLEGDALHVRIAALDAAQVEAMARRRLGARSALPGEPTSADRFLRALRATPGTQRLTETPLLLSFLLKLYNQHDELPETRAELYQKTLELVLREWPARRRRARRESEEERDVRFEEHSQLLEHLALRFHAVGVEQGHSKEDICRIIEDMLFYGRPNYERAERRAKARTLFQQLSQETGALRERGRDHYSFQHRTFQEFLVGRALAEQPSEQRPSQVREHLDDPRWREPILLCAGWLSLRRQSEPAAANLVQVVLDCPFSDEDLLRPRLLLAAELVAELSPGYREHQGAGIVQRVVDVLRSLLDEKQPPPLVEVVLSRLCALARAGISEAVRALIDAMAGAPGAVRDYNHRLDLAQKARDAVVSLLQTAEVRPLMEALLARAEDGPRSDGSAAVFALCLHQPFAAELVTRWLSPDGRPLVIPSQVPHTGEIASWPKELREAHLSYALWRLEQPGGTPAFLSLHSSYSAAARTAILDHLRSPPRAGGAADAAQALAPAAQEPEIRAALLETLTNPDPRAQALAAGSLKRLAGDDTEVRAALIRVLASPTGEVRRAALEVLLRIGPRPDLLTVLEQPSPDAQDRRLLVSLMDRPAWPTSMAIPRINAALQDPVADVRQAAARQARQWLLQSDPQAPTLRRLLLALVREDPHDVVREQALLSLSACAAETGDVRKEFERQLEIQELPGAAATAVMSVLPLLAEDDEARAGVAQLALHAAPEVRRAVARALGICRPDDVRGVLFTLLEDPDAETQAEAATSLASHLADDQVRARLVVGAADLARLKSRALFQLVRMDPTNEHVRAALRLGIESGPQLSMALVGLAALPAGDELLQPAWRKLHGSPGLLAGWNMEKIDVVDAAPRLAELLRWPSRDSLRHADPPTLVALAPHSDWIREMLRLNLRDEDPTVQARAVQGLAGSAQLADFQALEPLWETSHPHLAAALILHLSPRPRWRGQLTAGWDRWLNSEHGAVRAALACTLATHPALVPDPLPALQRLHQDELPWVRAWAVLGMRHHLSAEPRLLDLLLPWLAASGSFAAWDETGGHFPFTAGVPMLLADDLRRHLADALAPQVATSPSIQRDLESMLDSPDAYARQGATWTLWASGWDRAGLTPSLRAVLDDRRCLESVMLRVQAAQLLIGVLDRDRSHRANRVLVEALSAGQEPWRGQVQRLNATPSNIRQRALGALAETFERVQDQDAALQAMRAACGDPDPRLREVGWRALQRVRGLRGVGSSGD